MKEIRKEQDQLAKNVKGVNQKLRHRTMILLVIILVIGFGAATCRLAFLQVVRGESLSQKAVEQQLHDTEISAKRGTIYDRTGKVLAQSASVWRVVMAPANFKTDEQREYVAKNLSKILDLDYDEVLKETKENSYYVSIKRKIETKERNKILKLQDTLSKKYKLENVIQLLDDYKRYYPYNELASSVIGFTGEDDQGLEGLEAQYDEYLTGKPGRIITAQNAIGTNMPYQYQQKIEAQDGYNLTLTLDETIQRIMEKYVKQAIVENKVANRGCAIMVNVKTGAVLGMAVEDSFDPNDPFDIADEKTKKEIESLPENEQDQATSDALTKQWRNKAISDTYTPGSVFKPVTTAAVLSEKLVDDNTRFNCTGSIIPYEGAAPIGCHLFSGHGSQTLTEALMNSCNPAYVQMGFMLGAEKFYQYYVAFGFSEKTGIDLPGESEDIFFDQDGVEGKMYDIDLAVAPFGQNFQITPMQMIMAISALANDGKLMQPYTVSQITDSDGNVIKSTEPTVKRQVISKDVADQVLAMLEQNAISGGAKNGYVAGYRIGGKTGTSETHRDNNNDGTDDYIASFAGIAPCDDPEIALLCYFDTPLGDSYYGASVAGPCFRNIMSEVLPYLGVEKKYSESELKNLSTQISAYGGMAVDEASAAVSNAELKVVIKGDGDTVISQSPDPYSYVPKGGTVILYTDDSAESDTVTVPDFKGLSMSQASDLATQSGLNITISGTFSSDDSVTAEVQSIEKGKVVSRGTVITVTFEQKSNIM